MKTAWPCAGGDGWVQIAARQPVVNDCAYCASCGSWQPVWFDTVSQAFRWRAHSLTVEESVEVRAVRDAALLAMVPDGVREALDRLRERMARQ